MPLYFQQPLTIFLQVEMYAIVSVAYEPVSRGVGAAMLEAQ